MSYQANGTLHHIGETEAKTEAFSAREFVIETDGNYPQLIKFQLVQDRCDLINNYSLGESITVHFDLRGREWNGKYFTNLNAWKVEGQQVSNGTAPAKEETKAAAKPPVPAPEMGGSAEGDELPF